MQTIPHIGLETESIVIFSLLAIAGLLIDLFAHRADKPISVKAAAMWSIFWIAVGSLFGAFLWYHFSKEVASLYFAGYAFEMAISVDNLLPSWPYSHGLEFHQVIPTEFYTGEF